MLDKTLGIVYNLDMQTSTHQVRWFGVIPGGEMVPRNVHMNAGDWGWDAECSCGWKSRTGGAIHERIREAIADHRWNARYDETHPVSA